jgi:hypothetical protein
MRKMPEILAIIGGGKKGKSFEEDDMEEESPASESGSASRDEKLALVDELASAMGVKVKDREGVVDALEALVMACK